MDVVCLFLDGVTEMSLAKSFYVNLTQCHQVTFGSLDREFAKEPES